MKLIFTAFVLFFTTALSAQSYYINVKGGLTLGQQSWNNTVNQNSLLFALHGALGIETYTETGASLLAQVGYHPRGSAIRYQASYYYDPLVQGKVVSLPAQTINFEFDNVSLLLAAKKKNILGLENAYYVLGLRLEYTVGTNLQDPGGYSGYGVYPTSAGVNKFNYGLTLGGGVDFKISDLVGAFVELNVHPDFSKQYFTPSYTAYLYDYYAQSHTLQTVPEQSIRNLSFELSVGFKFLRKVIVVE